MAWESKPGSISLFQNKKTKEKQPDWRGTINIDGVEHNVSLWNKTSKTGSSFLSGNLGDPVAPKAEKPKWGSSYIVDESFDKTSNQFEAKKAIDDDLPW